MLFDDRPLELAYDSSKPVPAGYVVEKRTRNGCLIGGAITFGVGYAFSLLWAKIAEKDADDPYHTIEGHSINTALLYIPVLGPWIAIPTAKNRCSEDVCKDDRKKAIKGLLLVGSVQLVGAVLTTIGFTVPKVRLVRTDVALLPTPIGQEGFGLAMSGAL